MKTTSDALKSIKAQVKYMIDNQYYATLSILKEQNEMFSTKRSANDQHEISEFPSTDRVVNERRKFMSNSYGIDAFLYLRL